MYRSEVAILKNLLGVDCTVLKKRGNSAIKLTWVKECTVVARLAQRLKSTFLRDFFIALQLHYAGASPRSIFFFKNR